MKITFTPVGVSFSDTAPNIELLSVGSEVTFEHRPAFYGTGDKMKEYPNAVVVLFEGKKVGSLAESSLTESPQQSILKMIKEGKSPIGEVTEMIVPTESDTFKKTYKLSVEIPDVIKEDKNLEKSFNEDIIISYDPIEHTYHNGKTEFTPVTKYLKKFYKDFDVKNISKASASSWKVDEQDIVDLWEDNRKISAQFGTAIHDAMEFWEKYKKLGQTIMNNRGLDENYALPNHPLLRAIIKEFEEVNPIKDGDVLTEIIVTDSNKEICGRLDRLVILDKENKICRIGDYKVNVDSEVISSKNKVLAPLDHLPANKLSKYQIQMSIYANMLQSTGWTVLGLDAYVYEDGWKYHALGMLQVL